RQYERMDSVCHEMFKLIGAGEYRPKIDDFRQAIFIAVKNNNISYADSLLLIADKVCNTEMDTIAIKLARIDLYNNIQDYRKSNLLYADLLKFQDIKIAEILKQSVANTLSHHYKAQAATSEQKRITSTRYMASGIIICIVILLALIWIVIERRKRYIYEREAYISAISNMQRELKVSATKSETMAAIIQTLYEGHFTTLNNLCDNYYQHNDSPNNKVRLQIYDRIRDEFAALATDESVKAIEKIVNDCRDDIIAKLRKQVPSLSENEVMLMTFICAGMSMKTISLLTGIKVESVYSRKSRLKSKIAMSDSPDISLFIASLS
ncbi:MAG: hypothetical protein K2M76_03745, partial [Muribaculaceae bacterium]|nr:hypothetical protein [Muribaculaceae bacterium]